MLRCVITALKIICNYFRCSGFIHYPVKKNNGNISVGQSFNMMTIGCFTRYRHQYTIYTATLDFMKDKALFIKAFICQIDQYMIPDVLCNAFYAFKGKREK